MEIEKLLDLGAELEIQISGLYQKIAALTHDDATSKKLIKISNEELNHASSLKMGKNYLKEAPDIFLGVNINEEELNLGLQECREFHARLQKDFAFLANLKWILRLEMKFEKIHIGASAVISDAQLIQLGSS